MKIELHPSAEADVSFAAAFYEREGSLVLAARFVVEFERVARLLAAHPEIGTERPKGRKSFPANGFPYSVVYRAIPNGIRILVVRHDRRRPDFGQRRR